MAHRCVRKLRLANPAFIQPRHLHSTPPHHHPLSLTLPLPDLSSSSSPSLSPSHVAASTSKLSPLDVLRAQKADNLRALLALPTPSPNRVWGTYLELLQFYGPAKVPLDIHQAVLRKCAPPAPHIRAVAARTRAAGRAYTDDALYEARFQRIIRAIRAAGDTPALADYHCVLALFVAVGNHAAAMLVLAEIARVGLRATEETYALVLQALGHRLALPVWHRDRPALVEEVTEQCMTVLSEMAQGGVGYAPRNVDLAFRILKETMNIDGFAMIMRNAYGIDLQYPDRSPLEFWGKVKGPEAAGQDPQGDAETKEKGEDGLPVRFPTQVPFTLAAFNTALDYLARAGNISKLVQLFEVITTPLPFPAATSTPAFDEDDEDDFGVSNPQVAPFRAPHVRPNTTTFATLLRGVCAAHNAVLARHYLLVATTHERAQDYTLLRRALTEPPDALPAPRLSINRSLLHPVLHLANRDKDLELLRWTGVRVKRAVRWHRHALAYYAGVKKRWVEQGLYVPRQAVDVGYDAREGGGDDLPAAEPTSRFASFFSPSASARLDSLSSDATPAPANQAQAQDQCHDQDHDQKPFDIDLHLRLLTRELRELEALETHADALLARTTQRVKERLGRRVWGARDIYLRDAGRRTVVPREVFRETVNFRAQSELEARGAMQRRQARAAVREGKARALWAGAEREREERPHKSRGEREEA